jgi:hypothetical protein
MGLAPMPGECGVSVTGHVATSIADGVQDLNHLSPFLKNI